jgi:catechol 2,3-dioxygenase-like lactoylglutathione lyase family enzyme
VAVVFSQPVPILRIFDEAKAREFYEGFLGFAVKWDHRFGENFPLYLEIQRSGCTIHLSEHYGDCTPVSALRIAVSDAAALHAEVTAKDYRYAKPGYDAAEKDFIVTDPFGNRLIFHQAD